MAILSTLYLAGTVYLYSLGGSDLVETRRPVLSRTIEWVA
jgi:hypothetical protein